ncbi:MAG: LCP family protein [Acutalibacteraceae bacterium]
MIPINRYNQKKGKAKSSRNRIAMRISVCFLSIIFFLSAAGVLYVRSMLGKVQHNVIEGNESLTLSEIYGDDVSFADVPDSIEEIQDSRKQYEAIQSVELLQADYIQNILLIGSDTRQSGAAGNSDSMILVSINHHTKKIHLISLMRAMYVRIPKSTGAQWGMLNAAVPWGGPELLAKTIENNFRVKVDDYALVDFSGFSRLVDLAGGLDLTLTAAEAAYLTNDHECPGSFQAGQAHLNGRQALSYARMRHTDNDFKRTGRQRTVIELLMKKAFSMNLSQLHSFASEFLPLINTSLSQGEILSMVGMVADLSSYEMDQMMLPVENESGQTYEGLMYVNGMEVYKVNYYTNVTALRNLILGN